MSQLPGRQSYTSTSATVGGRHELIAEARRRQQEQQSQKAAEHAVKLKEVSSTQVHTSVLTALNL
jgi:hypothetical protein